MTNTSGTSLVPAALVSIALYVPAVAEVTLMVKVKLKEVVPVYEPSEPQGLPMVYPALLWLMALPFTLHYTVGHEPVETTANRVICPPTLGTTNNDTVHC